MRRVYSFSLLFFCLFALYCLMACLVHAGSVRSLEVSPNSITPIRTSQGYSTILEFQSKPTQAVLGDQDAFKLEFIGNSVTLKPLVPRAKSNLFIYTENDRFTFFVTTVPSSQADYLLRVSFRAQRPVAGMGQGSQSDTKKLFLNRSGSKNGFTLSAKDFEVSKDFHDPRAASILRFELSSKKAPYKFQPASVGLKQGSRFIDIQHIYLDGLEIGPNLPSVKGTVAVLNSDWSRSSSLFLVFAVQNGKSKVGRIEVKVFGTDIKKGEGKPNEVKKPALFQETSNR